MVFTAAMTGCAAATPVRQPLTSPADVRPQTPTAPNPTTQVNLPKLGGRTVPLTQGLPVITVGNQIALNGEFVVDTPTGRKSEQLEPLYHALKDMLPAPPAVRIAADSATSYVVLVSVLTTALNAGSQSFEFAARDATGAVVGVPYTNPPTLEHRVQQRLQGNTSNPPKYGIKLTSRGIFVFHTSKVLPPIEGCQDRGAATICVPQTYDYPARVWLDLYNLAAPLNTGSKEVFLVHADSDVPWQTLADSISLLATDRGASSYPTEEEFVAASGKGELFEVYFSIAR